MMFMDSLEAIDSFSVLYSRKRSEREEKTGANSQRDGNQKINNCFARIPFTGFM